MKPQRQLSFANYAATASVFTTKHSGMRRVIFVLSLLETFPVMCLRRMSFCNSNIVNPFGASA